MLIISSPLRSVLSCTSSDTCCCAAPRRTGTSRCTRRASSCAGQRSRTPPSWVRWRSGCSYIFYQFEFVLFINLSVCCWLDHFLVFLLCHSRLIPICWLLRRRVPRDGEQPAPADHLFSVGDARALRHPPRAAQHRQLAHRPRRAHRRARLGALHWEVPPSHGAEVL